MVEHVAHNDAVAGSIPAKPSCFQQHYLFYFLFYK